MSEPTDPLTAVESGWARSLPLPTVDQPFLEAHLAAWPELVGRDWEVLGGGLRTLNLRSGDVVARIALGDASTLGKEAALLSRVEDVVRVPRVLGQDARTLLLEHVPHGPLPPTAEAGRAVGRAAARIHAHVFDRSGMLDDRGEVVEAFPSAYRGLRAWTEERFAGGAEAKLEGRAPRVRALWDEHASALEAAGEPPTLTHADFKPTNLKWLPDEHDVLVLDWEFAWAGPAVFDAGMLVRWDPPAVFVDAFEEGYRENGGRLPADWRRLGALFDLMNLVGFLDHPPHHPRRDRDVLRRIGQTLRRMG